MIVMRGKTGAAVIPLIDPPVDTEVARTAKTAWRFHPPANYGKWSVARAPATN
jgi:hypothetical protein